MLRAHFCVLCGDALPARGRIDRKYCRASCRTLAYRRRKQEHCGPGGGSAAHARTDRRAVAAALVVRLEQLTVTAQQELAVARLQLAQLAAAPYAPDHASGIPQGAALSPGVQQLTQMLHAVTAQVQHLRTELEHWKATAAKVSSPPVKTEGPVLQGPPTAEPLPRGQASGPAASHTLPDAAAVAAAPKMPAAPSAGQQPAGTTAARAPVSAAAPPPSAPAAPQRPSAPAPPATHSSAAKPAPPRPVARQAPRTPPDAPQRPRSAMIKTHLHTERLLDRALAATHRRLASSGVDDRAILLVRSREAAHLFGKQLLTQLRPLLPATDRTAAARTAFASWVRSLYEQHPDKKIGIQTLLAAHRRELWLLARALMRLLEREQGAADGDEAAVDRDVDEDLQEGDEDLQEADEDLQEGDEDLRKDDEDLQEGDEDLEGDEED